MPAIRIPSSPLWQVLKNKNKQTLHLKHNYNCKWHETILEEFFHIHFSSGIWKWKIKEVTLTWSESFIYYISTWADLMGFWPSDSFCYLQEIICICDASEIFPHCSLLLYTSALYFCSSLMKHQGLLESPNVSRLFSRAFHQTTHQMTFQWKIWPNGCF